MALLVGTIGRVPTYYSLDDANALVTDVAVLVERLRDQRTELVTLRDAYRDREGSVVEDVMAGNDPGEDDDPELRRLRLRMRGIVDQMQADVAWLVDRSIELRDIPSGLIDFPALVGGRPVWLCWRLGERAVSFWHPHGTGFDSRRPIGELELTSRPN